MHVGFPRVARRLDVKMYPPCQRAAAVNYFTGSGLFCRALRYWCNRPSAATAALAAQHMPGGACFHLNDCGLSVRSSSDDAATTLAAAVMHPKCTLPARVRAHTEAFCKTLTSSNITNSRPTTQAFRPGPKYVCAHIVTCLGDACGDCRRLWVFNMLLFARISALSGHISCRRPMSQFS